MPEEARLNGPPRVGNMGEDLSKKIMKIVRMIDTWLRKREDKQIDG